MRAMKTMYKSLVSAAIAGVSAAIPLSENGLTVTEWLEIILAALVAQQATFWTPNKDDGQHGGESVQVDPTVVAPTTGP